jgi:hypothetical protein
LAQQHRFDDAVNRRIGSNADGQSEHGHQGEAGVLAQLA